MSRKNKNFRAFMFLNADRFPTTAETWNAAWEGAQKHYHTKRMQEFERQLSESRKLENKWLRIAQELERKNEVLEEANTIATALLDEATDMSWGSNEWLDEAIEFMEGKDVKGQ